MPCRPRENWTRPSPNTAKAARPSAAYVGRLLVETISIQGKLQQYLAELQEAIRLKPDDFFAHYSLALALQRENKLERAVAEFREAIRLVPEFASEPDLRIALMALGKLDDEITTVRNQVEQRAQSHGPAHDLTAGALAQLGGLLVRHGKWSEAEPSSGMPAIREKKQPDVWTTFNARSMLGGSLLGQGKHAEAEPLILSGYKGLKARVGKTRPAPNSASPQPPSGWWSLRILG